MSTSWGNTIYLDEDPSEMFGKIMSIPDELMEKYFEVLTDVPMGEVQACIAKSPRDAKVRLGKEIVTWLHEVSAAEKAVADFETKFVKKEVPDEMPEFSVDGEVGVLDLLSKVTEFAESNSEARRLVQQGGVALDGEKIDDPNATIFIKGEQVLKVGKRKFARLIQK